MVRKQHVGGRLFKLLLVVGLLAGCMPAQAAISPSPRQWTAWTAYWNMEGIGTEVEQLADHLRGLSLFAAYYDAQDRLFVPEELGLLQAEIGQADLPLLLTIVNDRLEQDGKASLKDRPLVQRLLDSEQGRRRHAREIITLAKGMGVSGIEMDYENLGREPELWQHYVSFIAHLEEEAAHADLSLSVILEPSALPLAAFPAGPQYVVMLYNLHGHHSRPGPKADDAFVQRLSAQMLDQLPGEPAVALATGGFVWHQDGSIQPVTEQQARALADNMGTAPVRDSKSGALFFSWTGDQDAAVLWYADGETIRGWAGLAEEVGVKRFYLWLLGGNEFDSLVRLAEADE